MNKDVQNAEIFKIVAAFLMAFSPGSEERRARQKVLANINANYSGDLRYNKMKELADNHNLTY